MNLAEFQPAMTRLQKVYGDRAFPQERVEIIYRAVQYTSQKVWEETVSDLIGDCMQAPGLTRIKEAMYVVRRKLGRTADAWEPLRDQIRATEREKETCHQCFGSGVFMAHKRSDERECLYCFACDCPVGDEAIKLPENKGKIRQWNLEVAIEWRRELEPSPPRREGSRSEAREAMRVLYAANDLNVAIGDDPSPTRRVNDDDYDPEK